MPSNNPLPTSLRVDATPTKPLAAQAVSRFRVVTRHIGAAQWVHATLGQPVQVITHLETQEIEPGCSYFGVFPLNLAAAICAAGAQCWAISVEMPAHLRGQELSAEQLVVLGARLVRYDVQAI